MRSSQAVRSDDIPLLLLAPPPRCWDTIDWALPLPDTLLPGPRPPPPRPEGQPNRYMFPFRSTCELRQITMRACHVKADSTHAQAPSAILCNTANRICNIGRREDRGHITVELFRNIIRIVVSDQHPTLYL